MTTEDRPDLSTPRGRLARVYRTHQPNPKAHDLVDAVVAAAKYHGEDGPTDDELLDALAVMPQARRDVDAAEVAIIDRARNNGITWDRIGRALGYGASGDGAAQGAQRRATTLRARVAGRPVEGDNGDDPESVEPGEVVPC
jgi:hypothetical protein